MINQRLISDARRRARKESRDTGRPYQTILEEIARNAGRRDWAAFVLDPADPVGPTSDDNVTAQQGSPDKEQTEPHAEKDWFPWIRSAEKGGFVPFMLGIAILIAVFLMPNYVRFSGDFSALACMFTLMTTGIGFIIYSVLHPIRAGGKDAPPAPLSRTLGMKTARRLLYRPLMRLCIAMTVMLILAEYGPLLMSGVRAETLNAYQQDVLSHRRIKIKGLNSAVPVIRVRRVDSRTDLSVVIIDARLLPRPMRDHRMGDDPAGLRMTQALKDNPVVRFTGTLDCTKQRFMATHVEVAPSYDAPAAMTKPLAPARHGGLLIDAGDAYSLCRGSYG